MKTALIPFLLLLEVFAGVTHARAFGEDTPPNMNGQYSLSPSGSDPEVAKRTAELFPKNFRDYPGGVGYFDVYSPTISSLYSQGRHSTEFFFLASLKITRMPLEGSTNLW